MFYLRDELCSGITHMRISHRYFYIEYTHDKTKRVRASISISLRYAQDELCVLDLNEVSIRNIINSMVRSYLTLSLSIASGAVRCFAKTAPVYNYPCAQSMLRACQEQCHDLCKALVPPKTFTYCLLYLVKPFYQPSGFVATGYRMRLIKQKEMSRLCLMFRTYLHHPLQFSAHNPFQCPCLINVSVDQCALSVLSLTLILSFSQLIPV